MTSNRPISGRPAGFRTYVFKPSIPKVFWGWKIGKVLGYAGTDHDIRIIRALGYEWDNADGELVEYRGSSLNTNHSIDFRMKHHVPLFRRKMRERKADALVEWWVTNLRGPSQFTPSDPQGNPRDYLVLVHYRPEDKPIAEALARDHEDVVESCEQSGWTVNEILRPDLPRGGIRNEVIVEHVLPIRPFDRGLWNYLKGDFAGFAEVLHGATDND